MSRRQTTLPLPHAYPFLLLDRVIEVEPGRHAVATKNLTRGDPLLDADGRLPAVLLAEAIAQCAGVALVGSGSAASALLARIDRFRAGRRPVHAGHQLRVSVRIVRIFGATVKARGVVRLNGRIQAAGEIILQLARRKGSGSS